MSLADALLRDICDHPEDDTPRLVYADWLEDQGQSAQAEYIRTQIALANVPDHDPRFVHHQRELRNGSLPFDRRPPRSSLPDGLRWAPGDRRGFPWMVAFGNPVIFLREAEQVASLAPIQALDLDLREQPDLTPLAQSPWLQRMVRLEFSLGRLNATTIRPLLESPHLGQLRELVFEFAGIVEDGLQALLTSPLARQLRVLSLRSNFFVEFGRPLEAAFRVAEPLPALEVLDLSDNRLGLGTIRALADRPLTPALRDLNLGGNQLYSPCFQALASWSGHQLETLRLAKTEPGKPGAETLATAPWIGNLRHLNLCSTRLGPVGIKSLAGVMSGLRVLDVNNTPLGDNGIKTLANSPALGQLLSLTLDRTGLTDKGARVILDSPGLSSLIHLLVRDNEFSPDVIEEIRERFGRWSVSERPMHARAKRKKKS